MHIDAVITLHVQLSEVETGALYSLVDRALNTVDNLPPEEYETGKAFLAEVGDKWQYGPASIVEQVAHGTVESNPERRCESSMDHAQHAYLYDGYWFHCQGQS